MKLKNMRISARLAVGFAIPIILSLILVIFALINTISVNNRYTDLINGELQLETQALESQVNINTAARYARDMVLDTNKSDYASNQEKLNEAISSLEEKILTYRKIPESIWQPMQQMRLLPLRKNG